MSFNSSKVQLRVLLQADIYVDKVSFNSSKVQLREAGAEGFENEFICFNSSKVQLRVLYQSSVRLQS